MRFFGLKTVSDQPVPEHVQHKEDVFQALTLDKTWDLNKNCIIFIPNEIWIIMRNSYKDMYDNKIVIQRNKL